MSQPNVLLITADQMRADAMGCAGNPVIRTPNLDALAASEVLFRRAQTPCPICVPARASITTGNYPTKCTGHKTNHGAIRDGQCKIAEVFNAAGYRSYALGKLHYVPYAKPGQPRTLNGFQYAELMESGRILKTHDPEGRLRGVEDYFDYLADVGWRGYSRAHALGNNDMHPAATPLPQEHAPDAWVAARTLAALRRHAEQDGDKPFFAWMSFPKPHSPYDPPQPYDRLYDPRRVPPPFGTRDMLADRNPHMRISAFRHGMNFYSPEAVQVFRAHYYGLVTFQDAMIGRVMDFLRQTGQAENTIVLYTADHGDLIGDYGGCFKCNFQVGSVGVPLIVSAPGRAPSGRSSDALAGLQDVLPTLASLAGVSLPYPTDGKDLTSALHGDDRVREVYIAHCLHSPWQSYMASDARWKYIYSETNGVEELYDVLNDPQELRNLIPEGVAPDVARRLRREIVRWCAENGDTEMLDGNDLKRTEMKVEELCHFQPTSLGWRWY